MSKGKDSSLMAEVRAYMERQNRPYSVGDVVTNMSTKDTKVSKTAVAKALEDMAEKEIIKEKVNGKQKVYFADQSGFEEVGPTRLKEMDHQIQELTERSNRMETDIRAKESRLSTLKSSLSADELTERLDQLKREVSSLATRLQDIDSKTHDFDPKANQKVKKERQTLVSEWRKRKRMATEMIDVILEGYPKPKKAFIEETGIETDEQFNAIVPQI